MDALNPLQTGQIAESMANGKAKQVEDLTRRGELLKASQEFESYFLSYLMKVMRETVQKSPLTENKMGDMFRSFYDEEIGKRAAQADGIGLSQFILSSLAQNEADLEQRSKSLTSVKS